MNTRATLFLSCRWICPNHRRRPLCMTSSIGGRFSIFLISSFRCVPDTPRIPRSIVICEVKLFYLSVVFTAHAPFTPVRYGGSILITSYTFNLRFAGSTMQLALAGNLPTIDDLNNTCYTVVARTLNKHAPVVNSTENTVEHWRKQNASSAEPNADGDKRI